VSSAAPVHRRCVEDGRLVYYLEAADAGFWDRHWESVAGEEFYAGALHGELGWFERPFTSYLPAGGRVLEAGCGLGQYVLALRARGYAAEGIDYAQATVSEARRRFPELPVTAGDATALAVPDGHYDGYISLGVVEHLRDGPLPILREAHRVLKPGGAALVSVPNFNALRRLKAATGSFRCTGGHGSFYQYAFRGREFAGLMEQAGFEVLEQMGYDSYKGVKDECAALAWLGRRRPGGYDLGALMQRAMRRAAWLENGCGHMTLYACRRRDVRAGH